MRQKREEEMEEEREWTEEKILILHPVSSSGLGLLQQQ